MMKKGALYLRSSKDRSDVSISAQRRELSDLATARGIEIVREYVDVVESAKSEHRPGFQDLLRDLKDQRHGWTYLLLTDTSRLSRRRYVAQVFKHEARKRGVEIIYSKVPETDPITAVIIDSVFEAMDEVHSLMSREKGLAGMAENVRQGFRAGGRAPKGYQLKRVETGAVRDGEAVYKTRLVLSPDAPLVSRYLSQRAAGRARAVVTRDLGITWPSTTLIGMEWRALTYAGHLVWNQVNSREKGRYLTGTKYRPRDEWIVQRDTHEALISEAEAEAILSSLASSTIGQAVSRARRGLSDYLLSGVLVAPDGRKWEGWKDRYRLKAAAGLSGKYLPKADVDAAVVGMLAEDLASPKLLDELVSAAKTTAGPNVDPAKDLRADLVRINGQVSRAMELALDLDDAAPALRKVNELEAQRKQVAAEIERLEKEYRLQQTLRTVTRRDIKAVVDRLREDLRDSSQKRLKGIIGAMVGRIILDPIHLTIRFKYHVRGGDTLEMASPREHEGWGIELEREKKAL